MATAISKKLVAAAKRIDVSKRKLFLSSLVGDSLSAFTDLDTYRAFVGVFEAWELHINDSDPAEGNNLRVMLLLVAAAVLA